MISLCLTKVEDVENGKVVMSKTENWGACPTRSKDHVLSHGSDVLEKEFLLGKIQHLSEKRPTDIFAFHVSPKELNVYWYSKGRKVESLKDGNYTVYKSDKEALYRNMPTSIKVFDVENLPNPFFTLDEMLEHLPDVVNLALKS